MLNTQYIETYSRPTAKLNGIVNGVEGMKHRDGSVIDDNFIRNRNSAYVTTNVTTRNERIITRVYILLFLSFTCVVWTHV